MFKNARIKLTAWYLLIIMFISVAFSIVIYQGLMNEVRRFSRMQRIRIERILPPDPAQPLLADEDLIIEIQQRVILGLGIINVIIFLSSGALGYFLAGKTLTPIQKMVDEQNRFVSDASHELKTPLTSLKTAMEVSLRDKNFSLEGSKQLIRESIGEVNKLSRLSDSLLQLSQLETPKENLKLEKLSLKKIIEESIRQVDPMARQKNIYINNQVKDFQIKGSRYGIDGLFVTILDNAIKYSGEKKQIIITSKKSDKKIIISIKDQGIGISKEDLPHIFDRFYRADSARAKKSSGGYGLGLSIAKKIVETHKGDIKVESKLGKGTQIIISLPSFS